MVLRTLRFNSEACREECRSCLAAASAIPKYCFVYDGKTAKFLSEDDRVQEVEDNCKVWARAVFGNLGVLA